MTATIEDDITAELALMEMYDQTYEIFDHERLGRIDQMSIIGMHPVEDPLTGGGLELISREIIACRLPELTNTPLLDLLRYPRWFLDGLISDAQKAKRKEDEAMIKLQDDLSTPPGKEKPLEK